MPLSVSGISTIDSALVAAEGIQAKAGHAGRNKEASEDIAHNCITLLSILKEHADVVENPRMLAAVEETAVMLQTFCRQLEAFLKRSHVKRLLYVNDLSESIKKVQEKLVQLYARFWFALLLEQTGLQVQQEGARARHTAEVTEHIVNAIPPLDVRAAERQVIQELQTEIRVTREGSLRRDYLVAHIESVQQRHGPMPTVSTIGGPVAVVAETKSPPGTYILNGDVLDSARTSSELSVQDQKYLGPESPTSPLSAFPDLSALSLLSDRDSTVSPSRRTSLSSHVAYSRSESAYGHSTSLYARSDRPPSEMSLPTSPSSGSYSGAARSWEEDTLPGSSLSRPDTSLSSVLTSQSVGSSSVDVATFVAPIDDYARAGVQGLVDVLTDGNPLSQEKQAVGQAFFATYKAYASSRDVFRIIRTRWENTEDYSGEPTFHVKQSILTLLEIWMEELCPEPADEEFLLDLRLFISLLPNPWTLSGTKLLQATHKPTKHPPRMHSTKAKRKRTISLVTAAPEEVRVIAEQLTLVTYEAFQRIRSGDVLAFILPEPRHPLPRTVTHFMAMYEHTVIWAKRSILVDRIDERAAVYTKLVQIAECCLALSNFSSAAAICDALQSRAVGQLRRTLERVEKPKLQCQRIAEYLQSKEEYKKAIRACPNGPCVPLLDIHLDDLRKMCEAASTPLLEDDVRIINFEGFSKLASELRFLVFRGTTAYDIKEQETFRQYIEDQFREAQRSDAVKLKAFAKHLGKSESSEDALLHNLGYTKP